MEHSKPLAIDLFAGLGGWTDGLLAEGWDVIGFDVERHAYGDHAYPAQLVLQDVLTLDGAQFRDADLIVASPPCQAYSYSAMPWSRAKALPPPDNTLFDACFRIQREASAAAGRHIPMIVENVRGAQRWVGRSRWNYGSFHLWGDVPALMPMTAKIACGKNNGTQWRANGCNDENRMVPSQMHAQGVNVGGLDWNGYKNGDPDYCGQAFNTHAERKHNTTSGKGRNPDGRSKSNARKAASAMIAKIPLPLARYIGRTFKPRAEAA